MWPVDYGFIPTGKIRSGLEVEIGVLGEMRPAKPIIEVLFDPENTRMHS
ncbi:MAG: hypothetical protein QM492_09155 [Rhodobacterales bacterium]